MGEWLLADASVPRGARAQLEAQLLSLLARQARLFTAGDSTSLPEETARSLLESVCFCLRVGEGFRPERWTELLETELTQAFEDGVRQLEQRVEYGKRLWLAACERLPPVENRSMQDTLRGIGTFFRRYDVRFFAHEIPCDIDYQLAIPVEPEQKGVDYVNRYLERLTLENEFLRRFTRAAMEPILRRYCPDYWGLLINLYEPVATNALGLALLGEPVEALAISPAACRRLRERFAGRTFAEIGTILDRAALRLSGETALCGAETEYLRACAKGLAPRIEAAARYGGMDGIFLSP